MSVTMEMVPCPGNWTVVTQFIDSYSPQYFYNRPWIIGGLLTLAVIGLVGNCSVVLFLFQSSKAWKSAFTLLVMQLALADGLVCLFCLLADAIWNVTMEWTGGTHLCRFVKYMQMFR
jgi:7 transmembrane receptor (rhodopsin family)